ncbi:MAG: hypothetical protein ACLU48_04525 [Clostridiaceae bacterium]
MEKRNTNRQREYQDEYRQHSLAWIPRWRRGESAVLRRGGSAIGSAVICVVPGCMAWFWIFLSGGKSQWKRDGGQCHRGINIPGI